MNGYYVFSDECGNYQQYRNERFIKAPPFYVRASVLIALSDYIRLEESASTCRQGLAIPSDVEIKWAELGHRFKGRTSRGMKKVSDEMLQTYISHVIECAVDLRSCQVFFSAFDNSSPSRAKEASMLGMHIQNALQRAHYDMVECNGFATMIIDDLSNEKNRMLKEVCHGLLVAGDFVNYSNVKKSILTDYSHHCAGLQLADYCAGIFTSCLKRIKLDTPTNYEFAHNLMFSHLYKKVRHSFQHAPHHDTYGYGVREVPNNCGTELCKAIATEIDSHLDVDLQTELDAFMSNKSI